MQHHVTHGKESAAQKNKGGEKRAGPVSVSIPNHLAVPPFPHPSQWPDDVRAFIYGPPSADSDGNPEPLTVTITLAIGRPSVALLLTCGTPFAVAQPQRPEQRPFPQSRPKILSLQHLPLPSLLAVLDIPPDPIVAAPTFPANTTYGQVHSNLALACACELPDMYASFEEILEIAGGPPDDQEDLLGAFPPDELVFLSTLAVIAALDPVFQQFLYPVIANFTHHWVAHLRQDSFG
ncbi:hypothetical protein B0H14DRAFT_2566994 [Mycena olivaceomarginata]|nr:hypothetical protein B0H14DRAFT_2566994 [Mycena olivaceomarginata]